MCGTNSIFLSDSMMSLIETMPFEFFFWLRKKVYCLLQGSEMNGFCLKEGQGLKASTAHALPKVPLSTPPSHPEDEETPKS